jgi:serine/threonine-protein kinase
VGAASTTQTGMLKGKMAYIAPEQARGDAVDARADVFSVGVMLWEAMAASRFAAADSQSAILARRLSGNEPRIRNVVPDADPELAEICDRAMAHDPEQRYPSAQALRDALETFLDRFSRRVGSREVGELLGNLFAEDRDALRKAIDEQMKRVMRETSHVLPVPTFDVLQGGGDPTPLSIPNHRQRFRDEPTVQEGRPPGWEPTPSSVSASPGTLVAAHISQPAPPHPPSPLRPLLIALSLLASAAAIAVLFLFFTRSPASPTASANASPAATTAAPPTAAAPDGEKVKLSITFGPAGTTAKLDGVPLAQSPFVAHVPRDGSMHRIDVEGPGLESQTKMISYDQDVAIVVELGPATSASASATGSPVGTGRLPVAPGTAGKGGKQPREIDEQDPYKK